MNSKTLARINTVLAVLVLICLVLSHLALADIHKGIEANLRTEWWVVRVTLLLTAILALTVLISARFSLRLPSSVDGDS